MRQSCLYLEVDVHDMTVEQARKRLDLLLRRADKQVREVTVIHGYRSGTALQTMVRHFKHPRVQSRILTLNPGETVLVLHSEK